jgi:hypothetical protein
MSLLFRFLQWLFQPWKNGPLAYVQVGLPSYLTIVDGVPTMSLTTLPVPVNAKGNVLLSNPVDIFGQPYTYVNPSAVVLDATGAASSAATATLAADHNSVDVVGVSVTTGLVVAIQDGAAPVGLFDIDVVPAVLASVTADVAHATFTHAQTGAPAAPATPAVPSAPTA